MIEGLIDITDDPLDPRLSDVISAYSDPTRFYLKQRLLYILFEGVFGRWLELGLSLWFAMEYAQHTLTLFELTGVLATLAASLRMLQFCYETCQPVLAVFLNKRGYM